MENNNIKLSSAQLNKYFYTRFQKKPNSECYYIDYDYEITRLSEMRRVCNENGKKRMSRLNLAKTMLDNCNSNEVENYDQYVLRTERNMEMLSKYFTTSFKFLTYKILLFSILRDKDIEAWRKAYSDEKMNEYIIEWAEISWEWLGMKDIEDTTEIIKNEYTLFKYMNSYIENVMELDEIHYYK